jgi:hypothetical protein
LKWRARFLEAIPEIENQYPKARWVFLTLTLKNCHAKDLRTTVKHMADAFVRLTQTKKWPAIGWIRSLEVTHSTSTAGDCHPHYHVLLLVKPGYFGSQYVSQKDFASMWKKAARLEYDPICHVRAVKSKDGETIASVAAAETLKYSVKPDEMVADGDWLKAITAQLFKVRGVTVGGMLRDLMRPDEPEPDEDEPEPLNEGGFLFQYEKLDQEYYQIRDDQTAPESAKTTKSINDQVADSMDRWKERTKAKMSAPCTKCGQQFVRLAYNQVVCKTCHSKDKER